MNPPVATQLPDVALPSEAAKEVALWQANAAHLAKNGLYDPADERGSCGVGLIVAVDGKPRREVVKLAIDALKAVWHRGAVDADGKTGDGAGLHVQIPQTFFREHVLSSGFEPGPGKMAVGMTFLPRVDLAAQERCRVLVEREILREGYKVYGWRQVPVRTEVIGEKASLTRPEIEQILIGNPRGVPSPQFELDLFVIRRRIERAAQEEAIKEFYFCSLSCRSIIYKGMFVAEQLSAFYPDLEDERFTSSFAIFHQRYSTNTFPTWSLAQPFRVIAHNGEINTLKGNLNWLQAHEPRMAHEKLQGRLADVLPVVPPGSSDSAALDAIFELMTRAGRHLPEAKALLIPEAWSQDDHMPQDLKDFYAWCNAVIEPWDGPAAICGFGGRWVVAGLDRNGLRPLRWGLTRDGLMFAGSETGMVRLADDRISHKGQLGPGQMIAVDLEAGQFYDDAAVKRFLAGQQPYSEWVAKIDKLGALVPAGEVAPALLSTDELRARQRAVGISAEDLELILQPMAETGKEAIGSMGDDAPLAVLSEKARPLHHFFRQDFSQVTNPPIDSLRERRVMSIRTRLGNLSNVLASEANQCRLLQLESPVVTSAGWQAVRKHIGDKAGLVDCTFDPRGGEHALRDALTRIRQQAESLVRSGCEHLFLTDEALSPDRAGTPMILATGAVHTHLLRCKLRTFTSLNVRSAECMDVHFVAVLIGVGATTVHPWLTEEAIAERVAAGQIPGTLSVALTRYGQAIGDGLLKIMAKMGISVLSSYRGGAYFEALGLSRTLVAEYFPGMPSRISGIGLSGIQGQVLARHAEAFWSDTLPLDAPGLPNSAVAQLVPGGFYRWRSGGERHTWEATTIHLLQEACTREDFTLFSRYSERLRAMPPSALRDLLDFRFVLPAVAVEEGESITALRKRLLTPGMSLGALSDEAHSTLNIAMNRIGARSDSGEGGEDPARFAPRPGGDNASAAIKQVASGRFGVTAEYLTHCKEIEIKIAQGAKPGEGGQLPGFKVTGLIARLRHATPGVTLISPPPHHDIYSIEDLAQLIYDLKQASPQAEVCVKLVSRSGIGAIAAGVAKAKADVILISGHVGGTGASPQSSVKFAGGPWELGLAETHQVLVLNRLRHRVRLRVDGGIRTGRDVVIGAMLGAEEFGIGTAALVAMGCLMVRQCHSNTCPVGICTQDEELRQRFGGSPEKVIALFSFVAEEVRALLAQLGFKSLQDAVGRSDLLKQVSRGAAHLDDLDLNPILARADAGGLPTYCSRTERNPVPDGLDAQMLQHAGPLLGDGEKMELQYTVRNTDRAIGTRLSADIVRRFGMRGLHDDHVLVRLRGSAGQSLGAFAVQGVTLEVSGDANDYVGKGLSGGTIIVRPTPGVARIAADNSLIGNTVLYGATAGLLLAAGRAGERFAVRNSGATAVIEGCGSNGCEYMTGGTAVILGKVGANFAAGMTGGRAFVWDPGHVLPQWTNAETVEVLAPYPTELAELRALLEVHQLRTGSLLAGDLLGNWDAASQQFALVWPRELAHLRHLRAVA